MIRVDNKDSGAFRKAEELNLAPKRTAQSTYPGKRINCYKSTPMVVLWQGSIPPSFSPILCPLHTKPKKTLARSATHAPEWRRDVSPAPVHMS